MKLRIWIFIALAAVALLATGAPVFRDSHQPSSPSATRVFDTILRDSYRGLTGFHTCLHAPVAQHFLCWAELHKGNRYQLVGIDLDMSHSNPVPTDIAQQAPWTRHPIHIASPKGHGTANTVAYAWEWLMTNVPSLRLPVTFFDLDGNRTGYPAAMFAFRCTGVPTRISCRNALGDAISFTPTAL
jgi:hypothetical protein